jgi:hypothetical protein
MEVGWSLSLYTDAEEKRSLHKTQKTFSLLKEEKGRVKSYILISSFEPLLP